MDEKIGSEKLFVVSSPRINRGVVLFEKTWKEHIIPEHPEVQQHLALIQEIVSSPDDKESAIYRKKNNPNKLCIVKKVPHFLPHNRFILIALNIYSDKMALISSVYPVDNDPQGMQKL